MAPFSELRRRPGRLRWVRALAASALAHGALAALLLVGRGAGGAASPAQAPPSEPIAVSLAAPDDVSIAPPPPPGGAGVVSSRGSSRRPRIARPARSPFGITANAPSPAHVPLAVADPLPAPE